MTQTHTMRSTSKIHLPGVLLLAISLVFAAKAYADQPPNIVLILSDDQAWTDYGFMGHEAIKTPHLDKLASRSVVFKRGYLAAPVCRPSLASMVTGLHPFDHGVTGNDLSLEASGRAKERRQELDQPLQDGFYKHPGFIELLRSNGYLAHQSGKWWEGSWKDGGKVPGRMVASRTA